MGIEAKVMVFTAGAILAIIAFELIKAKLNE
jgi:hypothetical protein